MAFFQGKDLASSLCFVPVPEVGDVGRSGKLFACASSRGEERGETTKEKGGNSMPLPTENRFG